MRISFRDFVTEELTDSQKSQVKRWVTKDRPKVLSFSNHVFGDQDRLSEPLQRGDSAAHPDVKNHLQSHGFEIKNYRDGIAVDKHGRDVKIGKALNKTGAPPAVVNKFANDTSRQSKHDDLHVVISRHPEDVAGMSTGRSWESCMTMDTGANREFLKHDIKAGTHVAYLTRKNDTEAKNPLARIALKPYVSEDGKHTVLRPETKTYGDGNDDFSNTVRHWSEKHFPLKEKTAYKPHNALYDDSAHAASVNNHRANYTRVSTIMKNTKETLDHFTYHSDDLEHNQAAAMYGNKEHLDHLMNHPNQYVRATVIDRGHPEHLEKGLTDKHEFVRAGVALKGTDAHRDVLVNDKSASVRRTVAQIDPRHHAKLAGDKDADVRTMVARRSEDPEVLKKLVMDHVTGVKTAARAGLEYLRHVAISKEKGKPLPDRDAY